MLMSLRNSQKTVVIFQYPPNSFGLLRKAIVLQSYSPVLCECQKLAQSQPPFLSVPLPQPQKYRDDSQRMSANCIPHSDSEITSTSRSFNTTQSSSRPNKDENACKKLCLLAYDESQH
ncbi:hypothetical protein RB195_018640 [Necator americanus]|uniref:Uncharacterized protein n=1 Tax=Necator americanus TaxID=51031 RepID=A0ABR1CBS8_NECAM